MILMEGWGGGGGGGVNLVIETGLVTDPEMSDMRSSAPSNPEELFLRWVVSGCGSLVIAGW